MSALTCSGCLMTFAKTQPVHLIADRTLCAACLAKSRYANVVLIVRVCTYCGRPMKVPTTSRLKHCCGSCRSATYGLIGAQR